MPHRAEGEFTRDTGSITTRITAHGRDGYPVEPGRYRLIAARACPWANRAIIVRLLLGLEPVLSMGLAGPVHDERSWSFDLDPDPDGRDRCSASSGCREAYLARFPDYDTGITVPAMVDIEAGEVVTNDYGQITLDLSTEWRPFHRPGAPDLYPEQHRVEIDEVADLVYQDVNNGVYQCGFAGSQEAYDGAYGKLFARLDWLSDRLTRRRYLVGDTVTEADVRLFTTLARFDAVYHGHFKCNRHKLSELPVLWAYARDLFQTPGFGDTIDLRQIKAHYYRVHTDINPSGIVPDGPTRRAGWHPTAGRRSAAARSATAPHPARRPPASGVADGANPLNPAVATA